MLLRDAPRKAKAPTYEPPLNFKRATRYLDCAATTLRKILTSGKLPHAKAGRRIFITRESLDAFLRGEDAHAAVSVSYKARTPHRRADVSARSPES